MSSPRRAGVTPVDTIEHLLRKAARRPGKLTTFTSGAVQPSSRWDAGIEPLVDFAEGRMPADQTEAFEALLNEDVVLKDLLAFHHTGELQDPEPLQAPARLLQSVYALMPESVTVWDMVVRFAEKGLELLDFTGELLSARPLAVRAEEAVTDHHTLKYQWEAHHSVVTVQRQQDSRIRLDLELRQADGDLPDEYEVELWQDNALRGTRTGPSDAPAVSFQGLRPGLYRLVFQVNGEPVGKLQLQLDASTNP